MPPKNIVIFASGKGSNAVHLDSYFRNRHGYGIAHLVSDRPNSGASRWAQKQKIPTHILSDTQAIDCSTPYIAEADIVVLAGYLRMIPQSLLECLQAPILNLHPSLLPKHGGQGMYGDRVHRAVLDSGDKKSGISIHEVNEKYDDGALLFQEELDIDPEETVDSLRAKIQNLERQHLPILVEKLLYT